MESEETRITLEIVSNTASWAETAQLAGTVGRDISEYEYQDMSGKTRTIGDDFRVTRCSMDGLNAA